MKRQNAEKRKDLKAGWPRFRILRTKHSVWPENYMANSLLETLCCEVTHWGKGSHNAHKVLRGHGGACLGSQGSCVAQGNGWARPNENREMNRGRGNSNKQGHKWKAVAFLSALLGPESRWDGNAVRLHSKCLLNKTEQACTIWGFQARLFFYRTFEHGEKGYSTWIALFVFLFACNGLVVHCQFPQGFSCLGVISLEFGLVSTSKVLLSLWAFLDAHVLFFPSDSNDISASASRMQADKKREWKLWILPTPWEIQNWAPDPECGKR